MQKPFVITTYAQNYFVLVFGLKKSNIFIFPIVNMAAKNAKIDREGSLDSDF